MGVIYKNGIPYAGGSGSGSSGLDDRSFVALTTPSAVDTSTRMATYPSGYTMSNCYIEAAYVVLNGGKIMLDGNNVKVWLAADGIYGMVKSAAYLNGTFSAVLRKIPN